MVWCIGGGGVQVCPMCVTQLLNTSAAAHRRINQRDLQFLITTLQHIAAVGLSVYRAAVSSWR